MEKEEKNYYLKKELSSDVTKYKDSVIMHLLFFLNRKMNSSKEFERGYSDLDYPHKTSLYDLFDSDQYLYFNGPEFHTILLLLDNNKLLLIDVEWPTDDDSRSYFWFSMYDNASDYTIKTTQKDNNKIDIEINNGKGNALNYPSLSINYPENLPKEAPLTDIIKPTTFEQIYKRGKVKAKQLVKKKKQG